MPYGSGQSYGSGQGIETRLDEFIEETNKKIEELEAKVDYLEKELNKSNASAIKKSIVNIPNLEVRGSLGATVKTIGDIVK